MDDMSSYDVDYYLTYSVCFLYAVSSLHPHKHIHHIKTNALYPRIKIQ